MTQQPGSAAMRSGAAKNAAVGCLFFFAICFVCCGVIGWIGGPAEDHDEIAADEQVAAVDADAVASDTPEPTPLVELQRYAAETDKIIAEIDQVQRADISGSMDKDDVDQWRVFIRSTNERCKTLRSRGEEFYPPRAKLLVASVAGYAQMLAMTVPDGEEEYAEYRKYCAEMVDERDAYLAERAQQVSLQPGTSQTLKERFDKLQADYQSDLAAYKTAIATQQENRQAIESLTAEITKHDESKPHKPSPHESRTWRSVAGDHRTTATLVETDGTDAKLRRSDGNEVTVPVDRLIAEDRVYISNVVDAENEYQTALADWTKTAGDLKQQLQSATESVAVANAAKPVAPSVDEATEQVRAEKAAELKERQEQVEAEKRRLAGKAKADQQRQAAAQAKRESSSFDSMASIVRGIDPEGDLFGTMRRDDSTLEITVTNPWHYQPYQVRLQAAQGLWEAWAKLHSPNDLDKARLKIVDGRGNEVGGSRVWGGSLIWVRED